MKRRTLRQQLTVVRHEKDAVAGRDPEECHEAHERRDAHDARRREYCEHPTDQRQRDIRHHEQRRLR